MITESNHRAFLNKLRVYVQRDRQAGASRLTIAHALGYTYPSSLDCLFSRRGLPSRPTYALMCARWPELVDLLPLDELVPVKTRTSKVKPVVAASEPKKEPRVLITPPPCPPPPPPGLSAFELGYLLHGLAAKPEAPQWLEVLESACQQGIALPQLIGALKAPMKAGEVARG